MQKISMGSISKTFALFLMLIIAMSCLTLLTVKPANAQTIPTLNEVSDYVYSENCSLTVKTSSDTVVVNNPCILSVQAKNVGKNVTVSGQIKVNFTGTIRLDSMQFEDIRTKSVHTALPSFKYLEDYPPSLPRINYTLYYYKYSIVLSNEETYKVTLSFHWGADGYLPIPESGFMGNLTVFASAGSDTIQNQDFTYPLYESNPVLPYPTASPPVPEFSWLMILPMFIFTMSIVVVLRSRSIFQRMT